MAEIQVDRNRVSTAVLNSDPFALCIIICVGEFIMLGNVIWNVVHVHVHKTSFMLQ